MPFHSHYPDIIIPETPLSTFVLERAEELGSTAAFVDGRSGDTLSYGELARRVRRLSADLVARGTEKGDVVALLCPNGPAFAVGLHATAAAGGVITPVNPLCSTDELAFQLRDSGAKRLLTTSAFLDRTSERQVSSAVEEVLVLGQEQEPESPAYAPVSLERWADVAIDPEKDVAVLPYSSGTTALPKGVMLTHRNLVANISQVAGAHSMDPDDRVIALLPFSHIYGLTVVLNLQLRTGSTIVTMGRFDLDQFLGILQDQSVTLAYVVPPIILALGKHPAVSNYDLSALRLIVSGAAPLDAQLQDACAQRLGCPVVQGYGMTEASPVTHLNPDSSAGNRSGSVGPPVPNTECKVVDLQTGEELAAGRSGEICVRGPQVMTGYLNSEEETAQAVDSEHWLRTGDIGFADEDGFLYVVDRLKEMIKYKGHQVAPAELEAILLSHPAVADAAVVPGRDAEAGEVPRAFVTLRAEVAAEELIAYVAERVAPFKRIHSVERVQEIPRSAAGKVLRRLLVDAAATAGGD